MKIVNQYNEIIIDRSISEPLKLCIDKKTPQGATIYIKVVSNVEAKIVELIVCPWQAKLKIFISLENEAKLTYIINGSGRKGTLKKVGTNYAERTAQVAKSAVITWVEAIFGADSTQSIIENDLNGAYSTAHIYSLVFGSKKQNHKIRHCTRHLAEKTTSTILARNILEDSAFTEYNAHIYIEKCAKKSKGYQNEKTLILSKDARIRTIPQLSVYESDVTCSHGVAVSDVNTDHAFYLRSRGIGESKVKTQLILAHLCQVFDHMTIDNQEKIISYIKNGF